MRLPRKPWPQRFWDKVDKTPGYGPHGHCWLWTASCDTDGYGQIRDTDGRLRKATHIMWELTYEQLCAAEEICHTCHTRACVNPSHLYEGTHKTNAADMMRDGTRYQVLRHQMLRGEQHPRAKLTEAQVQEIRQIYTPAPRGARHATMSQRILAKRYGISRSVIAQILRGDIWHNLL